MAQLEHTDAWQELLRLKDVLPLRDLAARFGTTPGAISAALRRTGTVRSASIPVDDEDDELPPEAGADDSAIRPGSKDALIAEHAELLGQVPDADIARRAGVSVRTVASFRARHGIPGYRGPRRERSLESDDSRPSGAQHAWRITWRDAEGEHHGVVLAGSLVEAATAAEQAELTGEVIALSWAGTLL